MEEAVRRYMLARFAQPLEVRLLSGSNNHVWSVRLENVHLVVKIMTDTDVNIFLWEQVAAQLKDVLQVSETVDIDTSREFFEYDVVITRFWDGTDLASFLASNSYQDIEDRFADLAHTILSQCRTIVPPREGYGPFKLGRPMYNSCGEYYVGQLNKFVNKIELSGAEFPKIGWRGLLEGMFQIVMRIADESAVFIPVDVNFKNFMLCGDKIGLLNIPIFAFAPLHHGVASFSFQTRGQDSSFDMAERLYESLGIPKSSYPGFFEAYNAVGVLAFYASDGAEAVSNTPMWGSRRPIFDVLIENCIKCGIL